VFFRLIVNAQISFDERTAILFANTRVGFSLPVSYAADDPSKHPFAQLLKKSGEREREMGVIEGGTVAGIVPDERFFAVNYPGYPSSLARATHTLGGEETIAKARSCDGTYLELKFRPEDPYAHAAFGEVHQTSDLLLRIKRQCSRRSSGTRSSTTTNSAAAMVSAGLCTITSSSPDDASRRDSAERNNGAADYEVHADIVARIENTYNFDGMADYQYVLAVHADAAKRSHKRKRDEQRFGLFPSTTSTHAYYIRVSAVMQ
jgi:general transcription factor 3C polypeptide 5 (transcription factor C subunit 1)